MKKNNYIFLILLFIFLFPFNVNAALCTSKKYTSLKKIAYKVELSYELKFDDNKNHYFEVYVSNLDKSILLNYNGTIYQNIDDKETIPLGVRLNGGITYEFNLYGANDSHCPGEFLYTKKLSVPKYNKYSEREECIEYEEFSLCNKWYQGNISDDNYFISKLEEYIESLKKKEPDKGTEEDEKNIFVKIIDFYVNNIQITLPITIIVVLLVIGYVIRRIIRRKNRIKLDD